MTRDNEFRPNPAELIAIEPLSSDTKLYRLRFVDDEVQRTFSFTPGQFVEISVAGAGEAPISLTSPPHVTDHFELCIKTVGRLTNLLAGKTVGDRVGVRGPYGIGFPLDHLLGRDVVFIAGGIGLAPLRSLIKTVLAASEQYGDLYILYGARNPDELIFVDELMEWEQHAEVRMIVDKGDETWDGCVGFVSDLVRQMDLERNSRAIVCGPPAMFEPTVAELQKKDINEVDIAVSVERRMKCGIGKCGNCIAGGETYVCLEGPVFTYEEYQELSL